MVSNAGPNSVTGATVSDTFSANLTSVKWTCSGSGSCTASGAGDINDTVNLPVGTFVTYTVNATVITTPTSSLVNTSTVSAGITDPIPGNNSATDNDLLASSFPPELTGPPDGVPFNMSSSSFIDLQLASSLTLGPTSQVIYYPDPVGFPPTLQMDAVILQIGDGNNWYTIFYWGDGLPNTNTDTPACPAGAEPDNCLIDVSSLTNSPGITINLNGLIPAGTYPYIRITSPGNPADSGDGVSIDAIVVVP